MTIRAFPKLSKLSPKTAQISDAVLRDFSGGLKIVDDDVAVKSRYATVLDNILVNNDVSYTLRFGTKEIATCAATIIGQYYFAGFLINVLVDGKVQKVNLAGVVTTIWTNWTAGASHVDFTEKDGKLIVCNSQDKEIIIDQSLTVDWLKDLGTGSNINTPIFSHITTVGNYVVGALMGANPEIMISSAGTSGTWIGDPPPNDSKLFNLGAYIPSSNGKITGLHSFKNKLIVFFYNAVIVVELGIYSGAIHTPKVVDTIFGVGSMSHKTVTISEEEFFFLSTNGIYSVNKNTFNETFKSSERSIEIRPLVIKNLPTNTTVELSNTFAIEDKNNNRIFYSIKRSDNTKFMLSLTYNSRNRDIHWSTLSGWDFDGGCVSEQKRVFFYKGNKVYQYGNNIYSGEAYYADYISAAQPLGQDISFNWETPWLDANLRQKKKKLLFINGDTGGTALFTFSVFVDKFIKDENSNYIPALTMQLRAGEAIGYGTPSVGFGGGRRFSDERPLGFPVEFKLIKIKITGATKEPLRFSSIALIYQIRGYKR